MGDTTEVDVEFFATPRLLRASSVEVRQALGRRLTTLQGEEVDIQAPQSAEAESAMRSDRTVGRFSTSSSPWRSRSSVAHDRAGAGLHRRAGRLSCFGDDIRHGESRDRVRASGVSKFGMNYGDGLKLVRQMTA